MPCPFVLGEGGQIKYDSVFLICDIGNFSDGPHSNETNKVLTVFLDDPVVLQSALTHHRPPPTASTEAKSG